VTRRILFVHEDAEVLAALQDGLRSTRGEWHAECATTTPDALGLLGQGPFDVVVADVGSRSLAGGSLFDQVAARQPRAIRFVLSASGARGMLLRAGGAAHQQVGKPVDLRAAFERLEPTLALGELLEDSHLKDVVSRLTSVPSLPTIYLAIMAELRQDEPAGDRVGELVARDAGMSAKLLQLVNSPFFGLRMVVSEPSHAVQLLGLETVRALVLSLHIFQQFDERSILRFRLGKVWRHSLAAASCARLMARAQGDRGDATAEAVTAALLHDIGKLVLASALSGDYGEALALAERTQAPQCQAERELLHTTHAEVGAYLLGLWGLPEPIVEAVAFHHRPSDCPSAGFGALGTVHAADAIEHEMHQADAIGAAAPVDTAYMDRFDASRQYAAWKSACLDADGNDLGHGPAARP
jgi:putative nucleotidyltransferase with HDIG domain